MYFLLMSHICIHILSTQFHKFPWVCQTKSKVRHAFVNCLDPLSCCLKVQFQPNCQRVVEPRMTDPEIVNWLAAMDLQIADPNALSPGLGTAMTADYNNEKSSMVREEVYKNGILGS